MQRDLCDHANASQLAVGNDLYHISEHFAVNNGRADALVVWAWRDGVGWHAYIPAHTAALEKLFVELGCPEVNVVCVA